MKLRILSQVIDAIDTDLTWRKKELTTAKQLCALSREHEQHLARRASVVLAYAHWEGFVKETARVFLNFVHNQGLQYRDLQPGVLALVVKPRLKAVEPANRITVHTGIVNFLLSELGATAMIPWDEACDDVSNMDSRALQSMTCLLGLEFARYATKSLILDERLVRLRHRIAHGVRVEVTADEAEDARALALDLMETFRTDSQNALTLESYRRAS